MASSARVTERVRKNIFVSDIHSILVCADQDMISDHHRCSLIIYKFIYACLLGPLTLSPIKSNLPSSLSPLPFPVTSLLIE